MRILFIILLCTCSIQAQELITGTFDFQTDPAKKYAVYVPSNYDANVPTKVIVGLHPWNTSKWDSESWAQELSEVAEANDCIVICPDGGADGQIDDAIDTAFTTFLIDEMSLQYNFDETKMYLMGFSWGGKTVYTYGLNHADKFAGFMPIGAAVQLSEVSPFADKAKDLPFYILHGGADSPNVRYYPLVTLMENSDACVETILLPGVGHTIDFPDQFNILNTGVQWMINNSCNGTSKVIEVEKDYTLKSNLIHSSESIIIQADQPVQWKIYGIQGKVIISGSELEINHLLNAGTYFIQINQFSAEKIIIL